MQRDEFAAIAGRGPVLLDGAMGTMLIAAGLPAGRAPEWWNVEEPEQVAAVHRAYVEAGSRVVHTNTFGASPPRLAAGGLHGRCAQVNRLAVGLARDAAGGVALIAGDVGPTGLLLPPLGNARAEELLEAFAEQIDALAAAGADLISIETMMDLRECLAAVTAARRTSLPVMASMTFETRRRGSFTVMGNALSPSLQALQAAGADAVGCNCSVTPAAMVSMMREARTAVSVPLVAQPNAGQPRAVAAGLEYHTTADEFARDTALLVEAGADLVGGCCGTAPDFIRALRARLGSADPP